MPLRKEHTSEEITRFLGAIDQALEGPEALVIIGGSAAILHHKIDRATADIDTFSSHSKELEEAIESAKNSTGLDISITYTGVADAPVNYEERLTEIVEIQFSNLSIFVPEQHDWLLMKAARADARDLEAAKMVHQRSPFDAALLLERFLDEFRSFIIGEPVLIEMRYLATVDAVFGSTAAKEHQARLKTSKK